MHCKHCGNQIDDDSRYCSHCGGQIQAPVETNPAYFSQSDTVLIVAFCMMVGLRLFWLLYEWANRYTSYEDKVLSFKFIVKPSYVVFWSIPLILAVFIRTRSLRTIFLLCGFFVLLLAVYDNFIKAN